MVIKKGDNQIITIWETQLDGVGYNLSRGHVEIKMDKKRGQQRKVLNSNKSSPSPPQNGGVRLNILRVCGNQNKEKKVKNSCPLNTSLSCYFISMPFDFGAPLNLSLGL